MKKKYKILLIILGAEFLILSVLSKLGLKVESEIGNAVGVFVCFLPLEILLFMLAKDEDLPGRKRVISNLSFGFIIIIYVGALLSAFCPDIWT